MQGQDVCIFNDFVLVADEFHAFRNGFHIWIISNHMHTKAHPHLSHPASNMANTDDAKGLAKDFQPRSRILRSKTFLIGFRNDGEIFGKRHHQGNRVFRHGLAVGTGGYCNSNAVGLAPVHGDIVIPHTMFAHNF